MDETTFVLAISALAALVLCIYLVFHWGRRIRADEWARPSLVSAAKDQEIDEEMRKLNITAGHEPLDPKGNPWNPEDYWVGPNYYWNVAGGTPSVKWEQAGSFDTWVQYKYKKNVAQLGEKEKTKYHEEYEASIKSWTAWQAKEQDLYERRKQEIPIIAERLAEKRVPRSMDVSILGGGFSFLLEFSTVIVIIFAVLILGVLGVMASQEISTILAAIAGYVLGKAVSTTATPPAPTTIPAPTKPSAPTTPPAPTSSES